MPMEGASLFKTSSFGKVAEGIRSYSPPLLGRRKETLHVLFIPTASATCREEPTDRVCEIIRKTFYATRGGVTRALRDSALAANRFLMAEGCQGSLVCWAVKEDGIYLIQVGSANIFILKQGRLEAHPGRGPSLGESSEPYFRLHYLPGEHGAALIAASEAIEARPLSRLERMLQTGGGEKAIAFLKGVLQGPEPWAFAVEVTGEEAEEKGRGIALPPMPEVDVREVAGRIAERTSQLGKLAEERLLPREEVPTRRRRVRTRHRINLARAIAFALPLIVLLLMGLAYIQKERAINGRFNFLLSEARTYIAQAKESVNEADRRKALDKASEALNEARLLRPLAPELKEVEADFQAIFDSTYRIARIYNPINLWKYEEAGAEPHRLWVDDRDIYVLDRGTDRVYHYRLNDVGDGLAEPGNYEIVLEKGQKVGTEVVGELLDMTWYSFPEPATEKGLLIIDAAGNLFNFIPPWGEPRTLELAKAFSFPDVIESYGGRLYVLDSGQGQIWRYIPGERGYENPPQPYFPAAVEMKGVRDMALDGYVYLLFSDGRILKFLRAKEQPFTVQGLEKPLSAPTTLFTLPEEDLEKPRHYLYVADPVNGRIVQLNKAGALVRQLVLAGKGGFGDIQDIFVDEGKGRLFVLSSGSLILAFLP